MRYLVNGTHYEVIIIIIIIIIIITITITEWMKKGYLEKFWNGVHLEEEEKEYLEICRFRKEQ